MKQMHRHGDDIETPDGALALLPGVITAGTLLVAFTLLAVDFEYFWVAFVIGFGIVLPAAPGILKYVSCRQDWTESARTESRTETGQDTALATLRRQYAHGELSDEEFERRVERLLEADNSPDSHR